VSAHSLLVSDFFNGGSKGKVRQNSAIGTRKPLHLADSLIACVKALKCQEELEAGKGSDADKNLPPILKLRES